MRWQAPSCSNAQVLQHLTGLITMRLMSHESRQDIDDQSKKNHVDVVHKQPSQYHLTPEQLYDVLDRGEQGRVAIPAQAA